MIRITVRDDVTDCCGKESLQGTERKLRKFSSAPQVQITGKIYWEETAYIFLQIGSQGSTRVREERNEDLIWS